MEKYKLTKTIRFKLNAISKNILEPDFSSEFNISLFINDLEKFLENIMKYFFISKDDNKLKDKLKIKNEFLKVYAKKELAERKANFKNKDKNQTLTISDYHGLNERIIQCINDIKDIYTKLFENANVGAENRARREKTGLLLKRLQSKLPFIKLLIENTLDKSETDNLSLILKKESSKLNEDLLLAVEAFLPHQSAGIPIAKASFNYYTINKNSNDNANKKNELEGSLNVDLNKINCYNYIRKQENYFKSSMWENIKKDINKLKGNKTLLLGDSPTLDMDKNSSLRQILKNIKAEQKKRFNELMQRQEKINNLKDSDLYLFKNIGENLFDKYAEKTKEIMGVATKLSENDGDKKKLNSEKQKIAQERGELLKNEFDDWKNFNNFYRDISQKHGRILSQIKGIEKEKAEAKLLQYWALILDKNNKHYLILIPKLNAKECKFWLENKKYTNESSKIIWFESLTYRSLQKLCFGFVDGGTNEFNKNILNLLPRNANGEFAFKGDVQKKIKFYKDVLNNEYAKSVLNLPEQIEKEVLKPEFKTLDDFKIALEKICYRRFEKVGNDIEEKLKMFDAQIFEINNYDFRKKNQSNLKRHTKIWKGFWADENKNSKYDIRLNPEITISYRLPKDSRVKKYGEYSSLYDENKNNRYLHPQYTLITTISENSNFPTKILAFLKEGEFKQSVNEFNNKINHSKIKFALGIDNGEVELSTLGVYLSNFDKSTINDKLKELDAQKYGFEVLNIKDLTYSEIDYKGKVRKIIQNPSYFLKKENYMMIFNKTEEDYKKMFENIFERKKVLSIDLTTAKVICGYIVINGDVPALFNLWLKHAQRNLFAMNDHTKKETDKIVVLKNKLESNLEKLKFAEYISNNKFKNLSDEEKDRYVQWIFEDRSKVGFTNEEEKKFSNVQERRGNFTSDILFAVSSKGAGIQNIADIFDVRNIFKKREEFYTLKSQNEIMQILNEYNTNRTSDDISVEELDLKLVTQKQVLVGNVVGVIDFLYNHYKERLNGEGLIVKEGFDTNKIEKDIEKFSGNIYRPLERKLYQKFQNYGLVPPIKNLWEVRSEKLNTPTDIIRLGNIVFVDPNATSQKCPICEKGTLRHSTSCSENCGFKVDKLFHSNDGIAGFNIAKRGFKGLK